MLRLSWSARPERIEVCRALSDKELEEREEHMRQRVECDGRFATYALEVISNGRKVVEAVVRGAGSAEAVTLFTLAPGDFVGELSFIDATPHYASVVAVGPARVFGLEREKLEALLEAHPQIVYRVMRAIVRTVHQIQRRLSMQSTELTNYIYKQHGRY